MAVLSLLAFAIGSVVLAGGRLFGAPGVAVAAFVVVLLGIVSSGGPLGSYLLPDAYRAMAPWLPVGPAYDALRGALAFGGEGVTGPAVVIGAWALAGIVAVAAHGLVRPVEHRAMATAT
jgi:ABC-type multidrug transport system permease subunit